MTYLSFIMTKRSRLAFSPRFAKAQKDILMTHLQRNSGGRSIRVPKWVNQLNLSLDANINPDNIKGATPFEMTEYLTAVVEIPTDRLEGVTKGAQRETIINTLRQKIAWEAYDWDGDSSIVEVAIPELTIISRERAHSDDFWAQYSKKHRTLMQNEANL